MKRYEVIVIGAGPAGLSAAIEAAGNGARVVVFDENARPGGQLFKQIHKFFGSREHRAKERGFHIGESLLAEAREKGVEVVLEATVAGIFENRQITVMIKDEMHHFRSDCIIIATGASENVLPFKGWTLPGVIGAGAAQTMMNLHGIRPGERILMVGSGNVGLVVGFQLVQAGCCLEAVIDAAPRIGGYGVHAAKLARMGVPFLLSHTILEAYGEDRVTGAVIAQVDQNWKAIPGTQQLLKADTICLAVGLTPMSQLARMAGCRMSDNPAKGGMVPDTDLYGETSIPGIYAVGDVAGIEEASSAMIQGRIAGAAVSRRLGHICQEKLEARSDSLSSSLTQLREGMFGHKNKGRKDLTCTDEGIPLSASLMRKGFMEEAETSRYPGSPSMERRRKGIVPVIECTQNIPCDPCQNACVKGCIKVGETITRLPSVDENVVCTGCGQCVVSCSGQAIFLVDEQFGPNEAAITIPYEFHPLPKKGTKGMALDRSGSVLGNAEVVSVKLTKAADETALLTMKVPLEWSMKARFFKPAL